VHRFDHPLQRSTPGDCFARLGGAAVAAPSRTPGRAFPSGPAAQLDTIYHEHFSYFSLAAATRIFAAHGLAITEVDELPMHWRVAPALLPPPRHEPPSERVAKVLRGEAAAGLETQAPYVRFARGHS
jgi:hypothetical protein